MCVAQLETPSSLKPGLQLCGNSCHSSPLMSHCGLSSGRPTYGSMVPGYAAAWICVQIKTVRGSSARLETYRIVREPSPSTSMSQVKPTKGKRHRLSPASLQITPNGSLPAVSHGSACPFPVRSSHHHYHPGETAPNLPSKRLSGNLNLYSDEHARNGRGRIKAFTRIQG